MGLDYFLVQGQEVTLPSGETPTPRHSIMCPGAPTQTGAETPPALPCPPNPALLADAAILAPTGFLRRPARA
jgi:hypothetical protein